MGMVAGGVSGIKLQGRDEVVGMDLYPHSGEILLISADGRGKRLPLIPPRPLWPGSDGVCRPLTQLAGLARKSSRCHTLVMNSWLPKRSVLMRVSDASRQTGYRLKPATGIDLIIPWEAPYVGKPKAVKEPSGKDPARPCEKTLQEATKPCPVKAVR
jgi:hypothetical protein